jgi:hypothetical protein
MKDDTKINDIMARTLIEILFGPTYSIIEMFIVLRTIFITVMRKVTQFVRTSPTICYSWYFLQ